MLVLTNRVFCLHVSKVTVSLHIYHGELLTPEQQSYLINKLTSSTFSDNDLYWFHLLKKRSVQMACSKPLVLTLNWRKGWFWNMTNASFIFVTVKQLLSITCIYIYNLIKLRSYIDLLTYDHCLYKDMLTYDYCLYNIS